MTISEETGWLNDEDAALPEDLPEPMYWRLLVMPVRPRKVSRGGILIAESAMEAEGHLNYIGKVVAMGGCCGKHKKYEGETKEVKVGSWVIYSRYAGQRIEYKGVKLLFINDDEVLALAKGPEDFRIHI